MAAPPILLVADDLSIIAAVKRVLAREGYECVLATSAADALIGWGHGLPGLMVLQPSVESDRGRVVLEELQNHPDAQLLRVVILGETIPGYSWPVEPLPLDPEHFATTLTENIRGFDGATKWSVLESPPSRVQPPTTPPSRPELEPWRVTSSQTALPSTSAQEETLEHRLLDDMAADVEAEAMLSVESSLRVPAEGEVLQTELPSDVLARAEVLMKQAHTRSEERLRDNTAQARSNEEQITQLEEQLKAESEARLRIEEERYALHEELHELNASLDNERELNRVRHENALDTLKADSEQAHEKLVHDSEEKIASLDAQLKTETKKRNEAERFLDSGKKQRETLERTLEEKQQQLVGLEALLAEREIREAKLEDIQEQLRAAQALIAELEIVAEAAGEEQTKRHALEEVIDARDEKLEHLTQMYQAAQQDAETASAAASEVEAKLEQMRSRLQQVEEQLTDASKARDEAQAQMWALEEAREALDGQLAEARKTIATLQTEVADRNTLRSRLAALEPFRPLAERLGGELEAQTQRFEETTKALSEARTQIQALETTAQQATERAQSLEARQVLPLVLPGEHHIDIARHGAADLEGIAHVVSQLVLGNAEARLELGISGGRRTVWLRRGQVIAAASTLEHENLITRARRDGLIDTRQAAELHMLRSATEREQLEALKARGFIRDIESVPLVQRYTEQVALDAFSEEHTEYRIANEGPPADILLATVPRPTLPILAESLRRCVAPDVVLEQLGGSQAIPMATDSELDARALGFSDRERKMLTWVDGEATVEDLCLASGLKADQAFRALRVAQLLGLIELRAGDESPEIDSGELDIQRLEAKFDQIQDADYFTILGLSRTAGTDEVRRAYERLSQEFEPLRFSGHPDPAISQRAQVIARLLEEAARALEDDRRRQEYARHLLD